MTFIMFFLIFFNDTGEKMLQKAGLVEKKEEDEVDENLGTYFKCLNGVSKKSWYIEEMHMRRDFGIHTIDDDALDKLNNSKTNHHKIISGCHNYEITSNRWYQDAFQYTPLDMRDTEEEKENSDKVLQVLNLAYVTEENSNTFYQFMKL